MARADLSSVEFVRMGSAPVSESLMAALKSALPHAVITNAYGTTEGGPVVFGPHRRLASAGASVGYPPPGGSDTSGRRAVAQCGSRRTRDEKSAFMNGYTIARSADPLHAGRFYRTGDVFRRDSDGFHFFVGRTDDMFVSGGENIYPGDCRAHVGAASRHFAGRRCADRDEIKGQKPVASSYKDRPAVDRRRGQAIRAGKTRRPISIHASCGSSTDCRSRPPTRWTAPPSSATRRRGSRGAPKARVTPRCARRLPWPPRLHQPPWRKAYRAAAHGGRADALMRGVRARGHGARCPTALCRPQQPPPRHDDTLSVATDSPASDR